MGAMNFPIYVQAGEATSFEGEDGSISLIGPQLASQGGPRGDYVFFGRVRYRGLTTSGHVTAFAISISAIMPLFTGFGGDSYNYHK
jgi:hypothetical protein